MSKAVGAGLLRAADPLLALFVAPAALALKAFRQIGAHKLPVCSAALENIGVWPIRSHFGQPLFRRRDINDSLRKHGRFPALIFAKRTNFNY